jgi:hypothetical protein
MFPKLSRTSNEKYVAEVRVERKSYVTTEIGWSFRSTNLYWKLVDPEFSLLELGFEWPSGRLVKCAVPLFNGDVEDQTTEAPPNAAPGTPFFDLSPWTADTANPAARSNHLEQLGRTRLVKIHNGLSIVCGNSPARHSVIYAERVICGFGGDAELVALTLVGDFPL